MVLDKEDDYKDEGDYRDNIVVVSVLWWLSWKGWVEDWLIMSMVKGVYNVFCIEYGNDVVRREYFSKGLNQRLYWVLGLVRGDIREKV